MNGPEILDKPMNGHNPHKRHRFAIPRRVRQTSALKASWFGGLSCLVSLLVVIPFFFSSQVTNTQRWVMAAWCSISVVVSVWGYVWHRFFASIEYEVWEGGPRVRLMPRAHQFYLDPEWLKPVVLAFARMWSKHPNTHVDAGKELEKVVFQIEASPIPVNNPSYRSDAKAVLESGTAIAVTLSEQGLIRLWGPQSQNIHGVLEYELGHVLMQAEGFASDLSGKEREQAWLRERKRLGLLQTSPTP